MISLQLGDHSCWVLCQVEELTEQQRKFGGTRKPSSRLRCSSTLESRDAKMLATSGARKQSLAFLLEHYPGLMFILLDSWNKKMNWKLQQLSCHSICAFDWWPSHHSRHGWRILGCRNTLQNWQHTEDCLQMQRLFVAAILSADLKIAIRWFTWIPLPAVAGPHHLVPPLDFSLSGPFQKTSIYTELFVCGDCSNAT